MIEETLAQRLTRIAHAAEGGDFSEASRLANERVRLPSLPPAHDAESMYTQLVREIYSELNGEVLAVKYLAAKQLASADRVALEDETVSNSESNPEFAAEKGYFNFQGHRSGDPSTSIDPIAANAIVATALHYDRERTILRLQASGMRTIDIGLSPVG